MRVSWHGNAFLPLMGLLITGAWLTLWLWEHSSYGRYLDHSDWTRAGIAQSIYGNSGLMAVAAISGLADVDAVTLSVAGMGPASTAGVAAVLIAIAVNSIAKSAYAWYAGGSRLGLVLLVLNLATIAAAAVAFFLLPSLHA